MYPEKRKNGITVAVAAILLVAVFSGILYASLLSIGAESGEVKSSRVSPSGLVSAGAPRSQMALKQMFDSMGRVRTNGNRTVYEPITEEYLAAVNEKIANGETPRLSVEEILYIISDSVSCAEKYDGVKLHGERTVIFGGEDLNPAHISALEINAAVYDIILYRIKNLCYSGLFDTDGEKLIYYPDDSGERSRERMFVFTPVSDETRSGNIEFYPGDGQRINLYPVKNNEKCDLKYMLHNDGALSENEKDILEASGYSSVRYRNVTPKYWSGLTECKAVIIGGRIIIIDPEAGVALDSAPAGSRTVSIAAGDNDGDGKYELYFTAYSENKSLAIRYASGENAINVLFETEFCIGAYETLNSKEVLFYRTEQIESGSYLNLLRRVGDEIDEIEINE